MKKIKLGVFFFLFVCIQSFAQVNDPEKVEIGIVEHLDKVIPLELSFNNEQNQSVKLGQLINKPTVLCFVYFDCPGLCSPLLDGVSEVIGKTDLVLGADYQVITISFNYSDTPEKAKQKKANFVKNISKEKANSWIYLTGDSTNIYEVANSVGFKFKRTGLDFAHPSAIMILSPDGKITRYLYGLKYLPFDFKMAIIEAQKGLSRPTVNKLMDLCFSYDPVGRRYAMDVAKISATVILFFIVLFFLILVLKPKKKPVKPE